MQAPVTMGGWVHVLFPPFTAVASEYEVVRAPDIQLLTNVAVEQSAHDCITIEGVLQALEPPFDAGTIEYEIVRLLDKQELENVAVEQSATQ